MPEESTTSDLVELARRQIEALSRGDVDVSTTFFAHDAVLEAAVGRFVGVAAIRGFLEDWLSSYEEFQAEPEEIKALGNGVTFAVSRLTGRMVGSSGQVQLRFGAAGMWADGVLVRLITGPDVNVGRAAAERLAEERA